MSLTLITHLIQTYGYLVVFGCVGLESIGIPLPGETAVISASLYAGTTHQLAIGLVIGKRAMGRLEERAEAAFPGPPVLPGGAR